MKMLVALYPSVQFSSVAQSCLTLCDPKDCSTPGFPVHHQLPELTQTHPQRDGDAIQPSYPLLSPPPPTINLSHYTLTDFVCLISACVNEKTPRILVPLIYPWSTQGFRKAWDFEQSCAVRWRPQGISEKDRAPVPTHSFYFMQNTQVFWGWPLPFG